MTDIQQDGRARRQQDIFDLNRTKLIDTAVDVINEVGDIREVTLTQIAKEAGVSPATAYNHFPDRMEDVFSAIVHSRMDVAANMGATLADDSLTVIEKLKKIPVTYAENDGVLIPVNPDALPVAIPAKATSPLELKVTPVPTVIEVTPTAPFASLLIIVPSFGNVKVLLPDAATGAISV